MRKCWQKREAIFGGKIAPVAAPAPALEIFQAFSTRVFCKYSSKKLKTTKHRIYEGTSAHLKQNGEKCDKKSAK